MLFISSSATTKLKPIIDKHTSQREKNLRTHYRKLSSYKGRDKKNKNSTKELQNSQQNCNSKFIPINNYFKYRLKFPIKKSGLMD